MKVQIINKSKFDLPKYETLFSAGMDIRGDFSRIKLVNSKPEKFFFDADVIAISLIEAPDAPFILDKEGNPTDIKIPTIAVAKTIEIKPGGRCLIPTGLFVAIPPGYEIQCRMRSGLALKTGLILTNGIGTIDADYRGEIGIILTNTSNNSVIINDGERLAQIVLAKHEIIEWEPTNTLPETTRGEGGFGHTGV